jgi:dihydropteroate synthase
MLQLPLAGRALKTGLPAFIMGILNITPDSFWQESRYSEADLETVVTAALKMQADGADIIDVGGESSRPGADYVSAPEEIARVIPVIREIRKRSAIAISVDTRKKAVMQAALDAGADILNDISALEDDAELGKCAADAKIPVILMHKRGKPATMQEHTEYTNPVAEVERYLRSRIDYALRQGVNRDKIILDPGIGFGKDLAANRALIKKSGRLCGGEYPVLMALSRKTCIGEITGRDVPERLAGTLAANMYAVEHGTSLVRVHDIRETADMLKVLGALRQ